ncbi:hypothetical protein LCGC14_2094680 [marine sediment metagenome]|uniref:Uncharacterized protein n=1 Tax=marine sediment metagenome TaxID=412755 RepID=A0A0F9EZ16_9ZZZZ
MRKSAVDREDLSPGYQKLLDQHSAESRKLLVEHEGLYQSRRINIAISLQSMGMLYTHLGGLLMGSSDPRTIYNPRGREQPKNRRKPKGTSKMKEQKKGGKNKAVRESKDVKVPWVNSIPLFHLDLEEVQRNGNPKMTIVRCVSAAEASTGVAYENPVENVEIAEVLTDPAFLDRVREKHGAASYAFRLWNKDQTLHSERLFRIGSNDEETEEVKCCEEVDPRIAAAEKNAVLMLQCFDRASWLMEMAELVTEANKIVEALPVPAQMSGHKGFTHDKR